MSLLTIGYEMNELIRHKSDIYDDCKFDDSSNDLFVRDCCGEDSLKVCRFSAVILGVIYLIATIASLYIFIKSYKVKNELYNRVLHLCINLTFLSMIFQ